MAKQNRGSNPSGRKPLITPQQTRAIELIKENILKGGTHSMVEILVEAGYSEESARQQSNIMAGIRPHLQPTIEWMEEHRKRVQAEMEGKLWSADYAEL